MLPLSAFQTNCTSLTQAEQADLARAEQESRLKKFMEKEGTIVSKPLDPFLKKSDDTGQLVLFGQKKLCSNGQATS